MPTKPTPRQEKNRHHLATCVVVLVAVPVFLLLNLLASIRPIVLVSAVAAIAILAVRTAMIEIGVRRPLTSGEKKLERNVRGLLDRAFGITFVEDSRDRSEQRDS